MKVGTKHISKERNKKKEKKTELLKSEHATEAIHQMFCLRCAKLQFVIMGALSSEKCCTNIRPTINIFTAMGILMFPNSVQFCMTEVNNGV